MKKKLDRVSFLKNVDVFPEKLPLLFEEKFVIKKY
jgi:hypothetical protein